MANLLYRLGLWSAKRALTVIIGWIVLLGLAAGAMVGFGGALAQSFSIPGTETERVTDQVADTFGDLTGASATVVFHNRDQTPFTDDQKAEIGVLLAEVGNVTGVATTVNPFSVENERTAQTAQLTDGQAQIDTATTTIAAAKEQLATGQQQLDAGKAQLAAAIAQAQSDGTYDAAKAVFDEQQATLDAKQDELTAGAAELSTNEATLADQQKVVTDGTALLDLTSDISLISESGATAIATVQFDDSLYDLSPTIKDAVRAQLDRADINGVTLTYSAVITMNIDGIIGVGEIVGIIIAALVLIVMMRAVLPAVTPLISSVVGVGVGVLASLAFSGVVNMDSVTPVLGVMLGLAVGIDYSLFILHRHRRQLRSGVDLHESIGLANGTAGNAVVFAGATVVVALAALLVTGIPFLTVMGLVGAGCVAVAVLVSITFTPALLALMKLRALPKRQRDSRGEPAATAKPVTRMSYPRAIGAAGVAVVALLALAIPALSMRLGLPDGSGEPVDSKPYQAYTTVSDEFGAGQNGPLLVIATFDSAVDEAETLATQVAIGTQLRDQHDVAGVAPVAVSDDRTTFAFQVIPVDGPSSESTENLVHGLRGLTLDEPATIGVAGQATGNIDVSQKLQDALPIYLLVVIGLSLIIMIVVFRSILVPILATGGYVLSLFAALGAVTAVYQWGWLPAMFDVHDPGPVLSFAPIIIMGVLFGLAMDYQLFLVSGMREAYVHKMPAREAVVAGLRNGRAVVTAAAIIMIAVFGGFIFSELNMIRPVGFGLAIGVLFDAFVVRMVIVPAVMTLLGDAAWWLPRWLDKMLPNVDVEGASLERSHPTVHADEAASDSQREPVPAA